MRSSYKLRPLKLSITALAVLSATVHLNELEAANANVLIAVCTNGQRYNWICFMCGSNIEPS